MPRVFKYVVATAAGMITAFGLVMLIESVSSLMHPLPADLDMNDTAQMAEFVKSLPLSAFIIVLAAWSAGSAFGAAVARRLSPNRKVLPALIVCGLLLIATVANLVMIPHPLWFSIVGILAVGIFGLVGILLTAGPSVFATKREILAPIETVFSTIAQISDFSEAVPGIVKIEFLTDQRYGVGTRFRETRLMNAKEVATDLEVTELEENQKIRIVSDAGGTIWDTVFKTEQHGDAVLMHMVMEARPYRIISRLMTPLIMGMVSQAVESDMDSVKQYCEEKA